MKTREWIVKLLLLVIPILFIGGCKMFENKNQHLDDREIMRFMIPLDASVFILGVVKNIDYNTKNVEKALYSLP